MVAPINDCLSARATSTLARQVRRILGQIADGGLSAEQVCHIAWGRHHDLRISGRTQIAAGQRRAGSHEFRRGYRQ